MNQESKIEIHLLITDYSPQIGDHVRTSCGQTLPFMKGVDFDKPHTDPRFCRSCLNQLGETNDKFIFAFWGTPIIAVTISPTARIGGRRSSPFQ